MKILFFIDCLSSGGKERRLTELMKMLILRSDIEFELVVMSNDIHYVEVINLNIKIHYIIRKTKKDISVFYKLYSLCRRFSPEILHCWDSMTAIYAAPICKLLRIRFINGMVVDAPIKQNIYNKHWFRAKLTFLFSDVIVGNSEAGLVAYNAPKYKSICVYNGFNFNRLNNIIENKIIRDQLNITTKYIIGMVASFSANKDYTTYFSAAQMLLNKRRDITFIAIGNGVDSTISKNLIDIKLLQYFKLLGARLDVESLVNTMDICVLATFTEGISNSIMEYMAMGKPVIATKGGGTCEIVEDKKTGILINSSNPRELENSMAELLDNNELRSKMGLEGKKRISNLFSIDKMIDKYIILYKGQI